jgi:hypothetical protein
MAAQAASSDDLQLSVGTTQDQLDDSPSSASAHLLQQLLQRMQHVRSRVAAHAVSVERAAQAHQDHHNAQGHSSLQAVSVN